MSDSPKVRVVIVDDIMETRDNIRRSLQFDPDIEIVGTAGSGQEAIKVVSDLKPEVVIMDINMPDMDGITATEEIRKKVPFTQIVILSVQSDPSYMRRAMLVGARDFITKPPAIDELISAIRRAGEMALQEKEKEAVSFDATMKPGGLNEQFGTKNGSVIVIYSPKGGVGKTSVATNLAVSFSKSYPEKKTLMIDGNVHFGDVAVSLNEPVKISVTELTSRIDEFDQEIFEDVLISHSQSGLDILAAPPSPEYADRITGEQFDELIEVTRQFYDYIIIDTSSILTDPVLSALSNSDIIVLITSQDIPSIKNISLFLNLADASGIERDKILFILNRFQKRISISPERIGENLRQKLEIIIPFDEKLAIDNSLNKGIPLYLEQKDHPFCKEIKNLEAAISAKLEMEIGSNE